MGKDEHEMLVEYSEMTAFDFNSKEYLEVRKDLQKVKETANMFEEFAKAIVKKITPNMA